MEEHSIQRTINNALAFLGHVKVSNFGDINLLYTKIKGICEYSEIAIIIKNDNELYEAKQNLYLLFNKMEAEHISSKRNFFFINETDSSQFKKNAATFLQNLLNKLL